jgi:hypothetical protein
MHGHTQRHRRRRHYGGQLGLLKEGSIQRRHLSIASTVAAEPEWCLGGSGPVLRTHLRSRKSAYEETLNRTPEVRSAGISAGAYHACARSAGGAWDNEKAIGAAVPQETSKYASSSEGSP